MNNSGGKTSYRKILRQLEQEEIALKKYRIKRNKKNKVAKESRKINRK